MPSVEYSTTIRASREAVWDFVKDMDNWAPFLSGYQSHKRVSDTESIWLLKGNLGGLTRVAEFRAVVIEWVAPDRVSFTLEGINEPMNGSGSFESNSAAPTDAPICTQATGADGGALGRLWHGLWRALLRVIFPGSGETARKKAQPSAGADTTVTFRLSLSVGGASGKIIDLLIAPLLRPTAEELMTRIANAIEGSQPDQSASRT